MQMMKRWTDQKLDKELHFARAAKDDSHPDNLAWLAACEAEQKRRQQIREGAPYCGAR